MIYMYISIYHIYMCIYTEIRLNELPPHWAWEVAVMWDTCSVTTTQTF